MEIYRYKTSQSIRENIRKLFFPGSCINLWGLSFRHTESKMGLSSFLRERKKTCEKKDREENGIHLKTFLKLTSFFFKLKLVAISLHHVILPFRRPVSVNCFFKH